MRRRLWALCAAALAAVARGVWELRWRDDFDGPAGTPPNASNWRVANKSGLVGNAELHWYHPSNCFLDGAGGLVLESRLEAAQGRPYTSCWVDSARRMNLSTGSRVEIVARLPQGQGMWPAHWLLPDRDDAGCWPRGGEIDIMERLNSEMRLHGAVHWANASKAGCWQAVKLSAGGWSGALRSDPSSAFRTFAMEWSDVSDRIVFFYEGLQFANADRVSQRFPQLPFYLILNTAIGGWPGSPNASTVWPQRHVIDRVSVYRSVSASASPSVAPSSSAARTPSPTRSAAGTPSATRSPSTTPSIAPSVSATPSITQSPLSALPAAVRVDIGLSQCLNFFEVFAFDASFRAVSALQAGASARLSSVYGTSIAANGHDATTLTGTAHSNCTGANWWQVDFAPSALAAAVFVNRMDGGLNARIANGRGTLSVAAQSGDAVLANASLSADWVQAFPLAPFVAPPLPDAAAPEQASAAARATRARYLRIAPRTSASAGLALREVLAFDAATLTNVAFGKAVAATGSLVRGAAAAATDGVFGADNASQLVLAAAAGVAATVVVDLGALFDLGSVMIFYDRFALPVSGAHSLEVLNWGGERIGDFGLVAGPGGVMGVVSVANVSGRLYAPSTSASPTVPPPSPAASPSATASGSPAATRSASGTAAATTAATASGTGSRSATPPASASASASAPATPSRSVSVTASSTAAATASASPTVSASGTGSRTGTASVSATGSCSLTASATAPPSATATPPATRPPSASARATASGTRTRTRSRTRSRTASRRSGAGGTPSPTATRTRSRTRKPKR